MKARRPARVIALALAGLWGPGGLLPETLAQGIINGDYEGPTTKPWERVTSDMPVGCRRAIRVPEGNPGNCARMGQRDDGTLGCNITGITQRFDCFENDLDFCTVTFDALYPAGAAGETPEVQLENGLGATTREIPAAAGWQTYSISTPFCSRQCDISFVLFGPPGGTTSVLRIDNVFSECTALDETSDQLLAFNDPGFPAASGDIDDQTTSASVPALSAWGILALAFLLLAAGYHAVGSRGEIGRYAR